MADWQSKIRAMLTELVREYELPDGSLYLSDNYGEKDPTKIISHSVCIWEPNFPMMPNEKPEKNQLVVTITPSTSKTRPDDLDLSLRETQEGDTRVWLPEDAQILDRNKTDIDGKMVRVRINNNSAGLVKYIKANTEYCIEGYTSKASSFGCCDHFIECSDAKKCVHENKLYSKACMYRRNLDEGHIFYGKNRNV